MANSALDLAGQLMIQNPQAAIKGGEGGIVQKKDISKYLNPRTRKVYNSRTMEWGERPTKWNKLLKLPEEDEELMGLSRFDLEDKYDVNQIAVDLGDGWGITDDYGYGFQVTRNGEPWKRFKKGGLQNETEVIPFNNLKEAAAFYKEKLGGK